MASYTFHSLSDADFEDLVCDLLQQELQLRFQQFAQGRDKGIDLLHGARLSGSIVVQCKHYCRSKYSSLKSVLQREEVPKIRQVKPSRYILATSLALTPMNKAELLDILSPHCTSIADIYGLADLNSLLRQHSDVETAHYKLWLTSMPVLTRMLRHASVIWNAMTQADIEKKLSLYVQTGAFPAALDILDKYHYCILSGIPGIGKTTLAQVLVTRLMEDGYDLIAVRDDIHEALALLTPGTKQIIYYDDFLGQSSIKERLGKNEDRNIATLLAHAHHSAGTRVVLTTREYILEDAKRVYEPLSRIKIDIAKCTLKVDDYTRSHRARILYNHVYFSHLSHDYALAIFRNKAYRGIIDHKNFSPRIVEWMTLGAGSDGVPPDTYVDTFIKVLNDPMQLWQHAFDGQISAGARAALYCLGSFDGWIGIDELRAAWTSLQGIDLGVMKSFEHKKEFHSALKQLEGSFTHSVRTESDAVIGFHNPSIKDYVRRRIAEDDDLRDALLQAAVYFEQVTCLVCLPPHGFAAEVPSGSLSESAILHDAIRRTLLSSTATYQLTQYSKGTSSNVVREQANMGARLARVAQWAQHYESAALFRLACDIAEEMLATGDGARVATRASAAFLTCLVRDCPAEPWCTRIVQGMVALIDKSLSTSSPVGDWTTWSRFVRDTGYALDDAMALRWAERAEEFCENEVDDILSESLHSGEMEQRFDDVLQIAEVWDVWLQTQAEMIEERVTELRERESRRTESEYEHGEARIPNRSAEEHVEIDNLFQSLCQKPVD